MLAATQFASISELKCIILRLGNRKLPDFGLH